MKTVPNPRQTKQPRFSFYFDIPQGDGEPLTRKRNLGATHGQKNIVRIIIGHVGFVEQPVRTLPSWSKEFAWELPMQNIGGE